jgi:hypothetical protein
MANHRLSWCQCVVATLLALPWSGVAFAREDPSYHRTVERVLKLLPERPIRVVIVDANQADADVRNALQRMDAFITKGNRVVYLTRHGDILQGALKESPLHDHILAAIIWHEMAHIEGAEEAEAQRREEALLTDYIIRERVDRGEGMRYLAILRSRRGKDGKLAHGQENVEERLNGRVLEHVIAVIECNRPSIAR